MTKNRHIVFAVAVLCVCVFCVLTGCTANEQPTQPAQTETQFDTELAETDAQIETDTGEQTVTVSETEPATEIETANPDVPTNPSDIRFWNDPNITDYLTVSNADFVFDTDEQAGTVLVMNKKGSGSIKVTLKYADYMNSIGLTQTDTQACAYIAIRCKVENASDKTNTLRYAAGGTALSRTPLQADCDTTTDGWQTIVFNLTNEKWSGSIDKLVFEFFKLSGTEGDTLTISSVTLASDINTLLGVCGFAEEQLGYGSKLVVEEHDVAEHIAVTAPDEDAAVKLWFDHITEKVVQVNTETTDRAGYTVRLAKNEIEDCQFFLLPEADRTFRVELSEMKNEQGNTLQTELLFQYYHNVNGVMTPDAIPPVQKAISVKAGQTQGFVVKVKSVADSAAGLYSANLSVYDDETGKCVKQAIVYAYVWDFTLTDETSMKTAMEMEYWKVYHTYPSGTDTDALAENYYNFLLDNRINTYQLPYGVRDTRAWPFIENPRVRCFTIPGVEADRNADYTSSVYSIMSEHGWLDKAYFYRLDEPTTGSDLERLKSIAATIEPYYPQYRMVSPFFVNINYKDGDMVEFMKPYINIWCTKLNAFTPRELAFIAGANPLQSEAQDEKYGEFIHRMQAEMQEGDELWTYFCFEPCKPYANWMATCDGTEPIITLWQCKLYGITGVLFWGVNAWPDETDTYTNIKSHNMTDNAYGDGILLYSGAPYGIDTPVSSLRLETIRDGIEDYEYLCMLEKVLGKDACDEYVRLVTTSVLNYTSDDDYLAAVRVMLGDRLEAALKEAAQ